MDQASHLDDDDDSIGGRCVERDVDDSERAAVRDLLASLSPFQIALRHVIDLERASPPRRRSAP